MNYIEEFSSRANLVQFFMSHKRATAASVDLHSGQLHNFPLKEYLVQGGNRIFGEWNKNLFPSYGRIWENQVTRYWKRVDVFHFLAHGHSLNVQRRAKLEGSRIVVEAVNTHPENMSSVLLAEREVRRLPRQTDVLLASKILEEIDGADVILVPSRNVKKTFVDRGYREENISVLPFAANLSRFHSIDPHIALQQRKSREKLRVVCVASVCIRKGQLYLLEAARQLGAQHIHVSLVGALDEEMRPLLAEYEGLFTHYRHIPNASLNAFLHSHDAFVLATLEEGMAVANCEAMASGIPVLTTFASGAEEVIADGVNGMIVRPGSVSELRERLESLLADQMAGIELGQRGSATMQRFHTWSTYAKNLSDIHREVYTRTR